MIDSYAIPTILRAIDAVEAIMDLVDPAYQDRAVAILDEARTILATGAVPPAPVAKIGGDHGHAISAIQYIVASLVQCLRSETLLAEYAAGLATSHAAHARQADDLRRIP